MASSPLALQGQTFVATGAVINLPAVLIIFLVTLSHLAGLRESGRFNSLTVVLKLSAVVLFITFGLAHAHFTNWMPILPPLETHSDGSTAFGVAGVLKAAGIVVFAYLGFDFLGTAAQETRDPQRNVPNRYSRDAGHNNSPVYFGVSGDDGPREFSPAQR
jgi:APA family basic amino acid/polyamine antiporter